MTDEEIDKFFEGIDSEYPTQKWVPINDDKKPSCLALDFASGGTSYYVIDKHNKIYKTKVLDPQVWTLHMKAAGVTYWFDYPDTNIKPKFNINE